MPPEDWTEIRLAAICLLRRADVSPQRSFHLRQHTSSQAHHNPLRHPETLLKKSSNAISAVKRPLLRTCHFATATRNRDTQNTNASPPRSSNPTSPDWTVFCACDVTPEKQRPGTYSERNAHVGDMICLLCLMAVNNVLFEGMISEESRAVTKNCCEVPGSDTQIYICKKN